MRAFRDERGTVLALSAVLIPIFIVLVALAYDVGTWYTHKRQLQNRADAAALAAGVAYSRVFTACNSPDAATKALAESTIEGAARLYAGDPQVAGPLHNTEVTDQTRVNVEINAPTALAGIWGMNFRHMPELGSTLGYPFALATIVGTCAGLYWYFKRKGWL